MKNLIESLKLESRDIYLGCIELNNETKYCHEYSFQDHTSKYFNYHVSVDRDGGTKYRTEKRASPYNWTTRFHDETGHWYVERLVFMSLPDCSHEEHETELEAQAEADRLNLSNGKEL